MSIFNSNGHSKHMIRKVMPIVHKIEGMADDMRQLSDEDLQHKTVEFRERLNKGESLDSLLPEAFAVVREASTRVLGLTPYPVQLIGGIMLYQGRIAEMKTGEGKTLVAALPSYLLGLTGKGVHVVTVNDYLARRDATEIGQIHSFLGLTVGCVTNTMKPFERKPQYACDVMYITSQELGFDYLRDNMAVKLDGCVQRDLHYCIIDEVDSILIDEARTPLIIAGPSDQSSDAYVKADACVRRLVKGESSGELTKMQMMNGEEVIETGDFIVNEKDEYIHLTDEGVAKVEKFYHIDNFASEKHADLQHYMTMALKAHYLFHLDVDYVVKDGEVLIVDENTGRILPGRRYSDGLHQAIEAKEKVEIKQESRTFATITLQNFFNKYERKSGMTGTAATEATEFKEIYNLDVVSIPTNVPMIRVDKEDVVYLSKEAKYKAVVAKIKELYKKRQPVLVGTVTIDVSEIIHDRLVKEGIPHQVLNAKFHEMEAEIVSHAGEAGTVTIATNMAGRGTDIKLNDEAREKGGLYIIGTERHESRRIDNQLRGRAGRQGDPGVSEFYISLEDDTLRLFGSETTLNILKNMGFQPDDVVSHRSISGMVLKAQKKIEGNNYGIRKSLTDFDAVNNEQRELIYAQRNQVLHGENMAVTIQGMRDALVSEWVMKTCPKLTSGWDVESFTWMWNDVFPKGSFDFNAVKDIAGREELLGVLCDMSDKVYADKMVTSFGTEDVMREVERIVLLRAIDKYWMDHIDDLLTLKQSIALIGYGHHDPVVEYRTTAYEMFNDMIGKIRHDTVRLIFRSVLRPQEDAGLAADDSAVGHAPEIERNDDIKITFM